MRAALRGPRARLILLLWVRWLGCAMRARRQPGAGWNRGPEVADGRGGASGCGCNACGVGGCVGVLRGLLQAQLHINYILIRFVISRLA